MHLQNLVDLGVLADAHLRGYPVLGVRHQMVRAAFDQHLHDLQVPVYRSQVQGRLLQFAPALVEVEGPLRVGLVLGQHLLDGIETAPFGRKVHGGPAGLAAQVRVCALFKQHVADFTGIGRAGEVAEHLVQGGVALAVRLVGVAVCVQHVADNVVLGLNNCDV